MQQDLFKAFVDRLSRKSFHEEDPTAVELMAIGTQLRQLVFDNPLSEADYPEAGIGQAVLHPLAVSEIGGASLYLVSDGVGVTSPPHEHQTWVVIVGLRGCEAHVMHEAEAGSNRFVRKTSETTVHAGEILCMSAAELHSTEVGGPESTYHLHLYGKPLSSLPHFEARCYIARA